MSTVKFARVATLLATCLALPSAALAQAVPSCYGGKLPAPATPIAKELFVVIDQTVLLDEGLKQSVANQIRSFLAPGNAFSVLVFSAYTQGKYTQVLNSGQLDHALPPDQRNDVSKVVLGKFDKCMASQPALAGQALGAALREAFQGSSGEISKSDVLASMKDISAKVHQSKAGERVVLLVSDMLENSSVTSFYANQSVRKIDPDKELKLTADNQLFGDFGDARLYVLGAGLLNDAVKNKTAYRDPKTMQALSGFWKAYFDRSKAKLIEFGQPALLNQVE